MVQQLLDWDIELLVYLNQLGIAEYDSFWQTCTKIINWIPLYLFLMIMLMFQKPLKKGVTQVILGVGMLFFVLTITNLSKVVFSRLRPSNNDEVAGLLRVLHHTNTYSFFSGHAASSFALTTLFVLLLKSQFRWVWVLYVWPLLFSFSRIYVGVHYPSDVLTGALFGTASAMAFYYTYKRLQHTT